MLTAAPAIRRPLFAFAALVFASAPGACQDLVEAPADVVRVRSRHLDLRREHLFGSPTAEPASLRVEMPTEGSALVPEVVVGGGPSFELMPAVPLSALEPQIRGVNHDALDNAAIMVPLDEGIDFFFQPTAGEAAGMESATGLHFPLTRQVGVGVALTLTQGIDPYRTRLSEARGFFGFLDVRF